MNLKGKYAVNGLRLQANVASAVFTISNWDSGGSLVRPKVRVLWDRKSGSRPTCPKNASWTWALWGRFCGKWRQGCMTTSLVAGKVRVGGKVRASRGIIHRTP